VLTVYGFSGKSEKKKGRWYGKALELSRKMAKNWRYVDISHKIEMH
jgi:hypothetical protein